MCYGPELVAKAVQEWTAAVGTKTAYIERGSPWENGYVESFNARLRDELLNGEIFYSLREAQIVVESWRRQQTTSTGGVRARARSVAGCATAPPATLVPRVNLKLHFSENGILHASGGVVPWRVEDTVRGASVAQPRFPGRDLRLETVARVVGVSPGGRGPQPLPRALAGARILGAAIHRRHQHRSCGLNILCVAPLPPHPGGSAVSCALLLSGFADAGHVVGVLSPITAEARAGDHFVSRRPDIRV